MTERGEKRAERRSEVVQAGSLTEQIASTKFETIPCGFYSEHIPNTLAIPSP